MTALRRQEFIKSVIRGYAAKKIPARPDAPHAAIILGAVEVLYFHTPDYATVNSYVELAKKKAANMPAASSTPYCAKSAATADK